MQSEQYDPIAIVKHDAIVEPDMIIEYMLPLVRGFVGMFTVLADFIFRPFFGTRVVNPVRAVTGTIAIGGATLLGTFMEASFGETDGPARLIGMAELFGLYTLLMVGHGLRVWRLMLRLDLERDSYDEGPEWFFIRWFPKVTWTKARMLYEPFCLVVAGLVLHVLGLTEPTVLIYLIFVAQMLFVYALVTYYGTWLHLRETIDNANRSKVLMQVLKGHARGTGVNPDLVSRLSRNVPAETRVNVARAVTGLNVPHIDKDAA